MSNKTHDFQKILTYINKATQQQNPALIHNLHNTQDNIQELTTEFENNAQHCKKRKNGIIFYHEIISLPPQDQQHITLEILEDIATEYLQQRAPNAIAYAKAHLDTHNPHIHVLISANLINSPKKLRHTKAQFKKIKQNLEKYQKEKYPQLTQTKKTHQPQKKQNEQAQIQRQGTNQKEQLRTIFLQALRATTPQQFTETLTQHQIQLYHRNNQPQGIKYNNKKYRLTTLGIKEAYEKAQEKWTRVAQREKEIEKIQEDKKSQTKENPKTTKLEIANAVDSVLNQKAEQRYRQHVLQQLRQKRRRLQSLYHR